MEYIYYGEDAASAVGWRCVPSRLPSQYRLVALIAAVGGALRGSTNAASFITERLEGRTKQGAGETSPGELAAREETQATIESLVRTMTAAKLKLGTDDRLPGEAANIPAAASSHTDRRDRN